MSAALAGREEVEQALEGRWGGDQRTRAHIHPALLRHRLASAIRKVLDPQAAQHARRVRDVEVAARLGEVSRSGLRGRVDDGGMSREGLGKGVEA